MGLWSDLLVKEFQHFPRLFGCEEFARFGVSGDVLGDGGGLELLFLFNDEFVQLKFLCPGGFSCPEFM